MLRQKAFPVFLGLLAISWLLINDYIILYAIGVCALSTLLTLKNRSLGITAFILCILLTASFILREMRFNSLNKYLNRPVSVTGLILRTMQKDHYVSGRICVTHCDNYKGAIVDFPGIYDFTLPSNNKKEFLKAGQMVSFSANLKMKTIFKNPGTDRTLFYKSRNRLFTLSIPSIQLVDIKSSPMSWFLDTEPIFNPINSTINRSLLQGMITGHTEHIPEKLKHTLQKSGIYHLFVISGFHFGILTSIIFAFLLIIPIRKRTRTAVMFPALFCILLLTAFSPSSVRAFLVISVYFMFDLNDIELSPLDAVGLTGTLMTLFNPFSSADPGFLLSFMVAGGIVSSLETFDKKWTLFLKIPCIAFISSAALSVNIFHTINMISPFINMIITPFILLIFAMFPLFLTGFPMSDALLETLLSTILAIIKNAPDLSVNIYLPQWAAIAAIGLTAMWIMFRLNTFKKNICLFFILISLFCSGFLPPDFSSSIIIPDTGQSQCVILKDQSHTILIDCADEFSCNTAVIPILKSMHINVIDAVFITHFDNDHAGGLTDILKNFHIKQIYASYVSGKSINFCRSFSYAKASGIPFSLLGRDNSADLDLDSFKIRIVHPDSAELSETRSSNSLSLGLEITCSNKRVTVLGDLDGSRLKYISSRLNDTDILVAPHHGSRHAAVSSLNSHCHPETVVVCCGKNNRFGFPSKDFLRIFKSSDIHITGSDGIFIYNLIQ